MINNRSSKRIGIIGAGIIGLSVANILQERYPHACIELTGENIFQSTTSWGAPGFVRLNLGVHEYENLYQWYKEGAKHYWDLFRSSDCVNAGISMSNLYYVSDKTIELPSNYKDLYHGFRQVNSKELASIGFSSNMKYGVNFTSTIVESRYYLPYLTNKFIENRGKLINCKITNGRTNVADWALNNKYDIVFNCSGLGSRELFEDHQVIPLRGQIIRVEAPWFNHSFLTNDDTYAFSCRESVVLGGFRQQNDWDLSIRPSETKDILRRISNHNVCLGKSKVIEEWTGLRPFRQHLRLEIEHIKSSCGVNIPFIHNYGHGSSGIGLSWGTSLEAVDLIDNIRTKL